MQAGDLVSGKYRLLRPLGTGGMGSVWAVRNELTNRDFAIKFLLPALAQNKEALNRFFLEARACGQIKHPAVVDVYDMGQADDGSPYLVMELLDGEGFDTRLVRSGVFPSVDAAAWIAFVARGLEEAHIRGLVHRDLKPGNIFFALDDRGDVIPKILDFGVSKATAPGEPDFIKTVTGVVVGSPSYMSPEQARGDIDIDGRSDVWSLGVILYETLTGRPPFDAPNYNALMMKIIASPHAPAIEMNPAIDATLSALVDECLRKDKHQRIGTARKLAEALEAIIVARKGELPLLLQPRATRTASLPPPPDDAPRLPLSLSASKAFSVVTSAGKAAASKPLMAAIAGCVLAAGVLLTLRNAETPTVPLAQRAHLVLESSSGELQQLFVKEAEQKPAAPELVLEPEELPSLKKRARKKVDKAGADPQQPAPRPDVHGGVVGAGF